MQIQYKILEINSAVGFITVEIKFPTGNDVVNIDLMAIATSEEDTEQQLISNIGEFVRRRYNELFPPRPTVPLVADMMVGKAYSVDIV